MDENENDNALANMACPRCKQHDSFVVEARVHAKVIDNGVEEYIDPMWEDDAGTRCTNCGFEGQWRDFSIRPYSTCVGCGQVIHWGGFWKGEEGSPQCSASPSQGHRPRWLTLGEFRDRTAHLPDNMPITVGQPEPNEDGVVSQGWYNNLHLEDVPGTFDPANGGDPSLILSQTDDLDSRQW